MCIRDSLQTNFVDIGPVNKVYNMLVAYDRDDGTFDEHCLRVPDYLWVAEDGLKMQVCFRVLRVASMASRRHRYAIAAPSLTYFNARRATTARSAGT